MIPFIGDLIFIGMIIWLLVDMYIDMRRREAKLQKLIDDAIKLHPFRIDIDSPDLKMSTMNPNDIKVIRHGPNRGVRK